MPHDSLDLNSLPRLDPPAGLWPAIAADLERRRRPRRAAWLTLAAAASVAVLVLGVLALAPNPQPGSITPAEPTLDQVVAVSASLEDRLSRQRDGLVDGASAESLAWLESELGWVDTQLSEQPRDIELWQQRVALLGEMTRRYERQNWQNQLQLVSH